MKIEKIKPIPKYILAKIQKTDKELDIKPCGLVRYYAYLTKNDGELCKVTCAVKIYKGVWYCKQVAVHGLNSDKCFCRDIECSYMGGFKVGFYAEGMRQYTAPRWFEDSKWYEVDDKYFNPYARLVNIEYVYKFEQFKYSACELYKGEDVIEYLRIYKQFPQAEYLVKLGLSSLALSKQILTKCAKDRRFRKWLGNNHTAIYNGRYYVSAILTAYAENKPITEVQRFQQLKKELTQSYNDSIRKVINGEYERYFKYLEKQNINNSLYRDYLYACDYLGVDMTKDKHRFPHNFMHEHDIRIEDKRALQAERYEQNRRKAEEEQKHLAENFLAVASKYAPLQELSNGAFVVYIAQNPSELVKEGKALHHCVGRMGYDKKFAKEQSLIFFVRSASAPDTPLCTIEYSVKQKQILQFYADHNTAPSEEVKNYVNEVWLPHANKAIRKLVA